MLRYSIFMKSIRDLPKIKRPRERLEQVGPDNLTEIELVAILLGSGTKKEHVLEKAQRLLTAFPLHKLTGVTVEELTTKSTLGSVQSGKIIAAIELGKRLFQKSPLVTIRTPTDVCTAVADIREKTQEYLLCLYMNARYELLEKQTIAIGSLNQAIIEPRDIFVSAVRLPASYIVIVHNHPSGDPTPSRDDIRLTLKIQQAGELLGILLVDHIIVTTQMYTSFRELQLIE